MMETPYFETRWGATITKGTYCHLLHCEGLRERKKALHQSLDRMKKSRRGGYLAVIRALETEYWVQSLLERSIKETQVCIADDCAPWFERGAQ